MACVRARISVAQASNEKSSSGGGGLCALKSMPWLRPRAGSWSRETAREILRRSLPLFLFQVGALAVLPWIKAEGNKTSACQIREVRLNALLCPCQPTQEDSQPPDGLRAIGLDPDSGNVIDPNRFYHRSHRASITSSPL